MPPNSTLLIGGLVDANTWEAWSLRQDTHAADHDMIYLEPFKGTTEIRKYFDKVTSIVPGDLQFFVEDITDGDPRKVGVKWYAI